jgi:hypothetical protein
MQYLDFNIPGIELKIKLNSIEVNHSEKKKNSKK